MDKLRLGFADTFDGAKEYFTNILSKRYEVIRDDVRPDYLIFGDRNFGETNVRYENCVRIFYTGENQRHTDYRCDFAITFDHPQDHTKMFRLPLYLIYEFDHKIYHNKAKRHWDDYDSKGFCSFIVKNPSCHYRNAWFQGLNKFQPVMSAGPLFNNMPDGYRPPDVVSKVNFMGGYKFNLCFENSSYPGYCTEKLFEALCARTIPIYWGSSTAGLDFNPKAFLNRHDFANDQAFFDQIVYLSQNKNAYNEVYMQDMFRFEDSKMYSENYFLDWFQSNVYQGVINE